jgi:uncharacterized membrane protein
MPRLRTIVVAAAVGLAVGTYLLAFVRWPAFLAVAVGAVMTVVILLLAASIEDDAELADNAWREAAPDLAGHRSPADPGDDVEAP